MSRSWLRRLFGRTNSPIRTTPSKALQPLLRLEDRITPATFLESGNTLTLGLLANENVSFVANAATYTLTLGGAAVWGGTNSANVTGNGTGTLTVTAAGIAAYTSINVGGPSGGNALTFGASTGSVSQDVAITLATAASPAVTFAGDTKFAAANTLKITTPGHDVTQTAGTITIPGTLNIDNNTGVTSLLTATNDFGTVQVTSGKDVSLVDANSVIFAGSTLSGTLTATAGTGSITGTGTIQASSIVLSAGTGIGTVGTPLSTKINFLTANTTSNGAGIFVTESDNLTLAKVGAINGVASNNGSIVLKTTSGNFDTNSTAISSGSSSITVSVGGLDHKFDNSSGLLQALNNSISVTADHMLLGNTANSIDAGNGQITLTPMTAARPLDLGAATDPDGTLSLSNAELDTLTTTGLVQLGNASAGTISVSAAITFPHDFTLITGTGITGSGDIINGSATATTLTVDQAGNSTYSGRIGGPAGGTANDKNLAFVKLGAGTLTLSGNSTYSGTTTVSAGTLLVDGASGTGNATVQSGATIGGTGTIGAANVTDLTIQSGGTLSPGDNGVGTLTVGNLLTLQTGSTFFVEIGSGALADQVAAADLLVGNNANLLGTATLPLAASKYTLISLPAGLGIAGTGFKDANGTSLPPFAGGPIVVGGKQFNYSFTISGFFLTAIGTSVALDGSGNLNINDLIDKDDTLTISRVGANIRVSDPNNTLLAGAGVTQIDSHTVEVPFANVTGKIQVNTGKGNDAVTLLLANGILPAGGIDYDGGTGGSDFLAVAGSGVESANYTPSATTTGNGTVAVGGQNISFSNLEPVDISGMLLATVTLPGADDQVDVVNGFDVATGAVPALIVSGTSGGVTFESAHLFNNTTAVIDTTGTDGVDTITVTSANNAHKNTNLTINTGTKGDTLTVNGAVSAAGDIKFTSNVIAVNADITSTSGDIVLTTNDTAAAGDDITVKAGVTIQATAGNATLQAGDDVALNNGTTVKATAKAVTLTAAFGDTDSRGGITSGTATISAGTDITLTARDGIAVPAATATGTVTITSVKAAITDANAASMNVTAVSLVASAVSGIDLDTMVTNITATTSGTGDIVINEANGANLLNVAAATGNATVTTATGDLNVTTVSASVAVNLQAVTGAITDANGAGVTNVTGGAIKLLADGAAGINLDVFTTTPATVGLTATTTNDPIVIRGQNNTQLQIANVNAGAGTVTLSASNGNLTNLTPNDLVADVIGSMVTLSATGTGTIGLAGPLFFEIDATFLNASTANQNLWISDVAGGVGINSVNAGLATAVLQSNIGAMTSTTVDGAADVIAATVILRGTNGGSFGTSTASPLEINATTLDATAAGTGSISVRDTAGGVDVTQAKTANGPINLEAAGAAATLTLSGSVSAPGNTVVLQATGGANQTGGTIAATNLEVKVTGTATLGKINDVDVFAANTTGNLTFNDTDGFAIGQVNATKGINAVGQTVALGTGSGGVTQNAGMIIVANGLELIGDFSAPVGTGTFTLTDANKINVLATNVNAAVSVTDANPLVVGLVNGSSGITTNFHPLSLNAPGITQTNPLFAMSLDLKGAGAFILNLINDVDTLTANTTGGQVTYRDGDDLTIGASGIKTGGQQLTLRTGTSFTLGSGITINLGGATGAVFAGLNDASKSDTSTTVTLSGTIIADPVNGFAITGGIGSNAFKVTPSVTVPIFIFGNSPVQAEVSATIPGDSLTTASVPNALVGSFVINPINNKRAFTYTDKTTNLESRRPIIFENIENIKGLSAEVFSVQNTANNYQIVANATLNGQPIVGGFTGTLPPTAPFLAAPQFVNAAGPFTAPRIALGDINGDHVQDLIIGYGGNSGSPLVTVVDGKRIIDSSLSVNSALANTDILAQFYAYDPKFQGGVFVASADFNGDGRSEIITGAGAGGGPDVKVFQYLPGQPLSSNIAAVTEFFAYESNFHGGVRVAAGDVNGDGKPDIVTAPGAGRSSLIKVFNGHTLNPTGALAPMNQFLAYAAGFQGGAFLDVGRYTPAGGAPDKFADIVTGAGFGGGPHVRVFDATTLPTNGSLAASTIEFFNDPPGSDGVVDQSVLTAGVSSVAFADTNGDGRLDIFVGTGVGRRTRMRAYLNGLATPEFDGLTEKDYLNVGKAVPGPYDLRLDGAFAAVSVDNI
jgi:fibronectin-binding autotransporter adhesin